MESTGFPSGGNVPRQQKQKKPVETELARDPAERKRVLNVLAQRRYRQRKREQQAQLESFIRAIGPSSDTHESPSDGSSQSDSLFSPPQWSSTQLGLEPVGQASADESLALIRSPRNQSWSPRFGDHSAPTQLVEVDSLESAFSTFIDYPLETPSDKTPTNPSSDNGVPLPEEWPSMPSLDLALQFSNFLQNDEIQSSTFADDYIVSVPELDLLRASHTIALRIHSMDRVWDPEANSIFQSQTSFDWTELPENLRPTQTQLTLPHHPVLDLLPWPKVRTKLITMYNMPAELWPRHPIDKTEMSPFRLICDLEDGGVRIFGNDPTSELSWEIQQTFLNAWWWALDHNVVFVSNQKRKARGEEVLRLGALGS